jgi:hypothetical protein
VRRRAQIEERDKDQGGAEQAHAKNAGLLERLAHLRPLLVFGFPRPRPLAKMVNFAIIIRSTGYPAVECAGCPDSDGISRKRPIMDRECTYALSARPLSLHRNGIQRDPVVVIWRHWTGLSTDHFIA